MRKPSLKKSLKARTTGKMKRAVKKAVIPGYGKKGTGWIKNPKKAAYNKVYSKTTVGVGDLITPSKPKKTGGKSPKTANSNTRRRSFGFRDFFYIFGWRAALIIAVPIFIIIVLIAAILTPSLESITISIPDYQDEYDLRTDIPVSIEILPEGAADAPYLDYKTDSYNITFSEDGINTGWHEGTYEVYAEWGSVKSNTLTINVVDMNARAEAEQKAEEERLAEEQRAAEEAAEQEAEEKRLAEEQKKAEEQAAQEAALAAEEDRIAQEAMAAQSENDGSGGGNSQEPSGGNSNFNSHDNPEQQQTSASYVLNTNTGKFHNPSCKSVAKIAPQNYATSNSSRDELIAQGYSPCGNCHP